MSVSQADGALGPLPFLLVKLQMRPHSPVNFWMNSKTVRSSIQFSKPGSLRRGGGNNTKGPHSSLGYLQSAPETILPLQRNQPALVQEIPTIQVGT